MALQVALTLLIIFVVMLCLGVPISVSLAIPAIASMAIIYDLDVIFLSGAQTIFNNISSFTLTAIPFFVLSGVLMSHGGISRRLINFAQLLIGKLPGSLLHTNIVANMLFGAISGSAVAAATSIGQVMGPLQEEDGYDPVISATVNIASAPTGLLIPPSNTLILYSLVSGGTSIAALFLAGYVPGILWGISVMVVAYFTAKKVKNPIVDRPSFREGLKVTAQAIPSLLLIIIVIGGIIFGLFTPTEGAAVAVVYSLILSILYKRFSLKMVPQILVETAQTTGIIMLLIGTSSMMVHILSIAAIPDIIANVVLNTTDNPYLILLLISLFLLIIGTFMDIAPAVLIFTPIFLPIVQSFGMHIVHFGIFITFAMCMGGITPPVGNILFAGSAVSNVSVEKIMRNILPFYGAIIIVLILVAFLPQLSLTLPRLLGLIY